MLVSNLGDVSRNFEQQKSHAFADDSMMLIRLQGCQLYPEVVLQVAQNCGIHGLL
jgi:hypothetical protein